MLKTKQKNPSRRGKRRRRAQGKATAKVQNEWNAWSNQSSRRRASKNVQSRMKRTTAFGRTGFYQTSVAGLSSSLPHTFHYTHFQHGKLQGLRCSGISPISYVYYQGSSALPLFRQFDGTNTGAIPMNPNELFPPTSNEVQLMSTMTKYRFTKARIWYQGFVNTNVAGGFSFGYYADGAIQSGDVGAALLLAQPGTVTGQVWNSMHSTDITEFLDNDTWFYIDYDNDSDAGLRLAIQGNVIGIWNAFPTTVSVAYGFIYLEYEVDLIEPRYMADYALSSKLSPSERSAYREYQLNKRKSMKEASIAEFRSTYKGFPEDEKKKSVWAKDDPLPDPLYFSDGVEGRRTVYQLLPLEGKTEISSSVDVKVVNSEPLDVKVTNAAEDAIPIYFPSGPLSVVGDVKVVNAEENMIPMYSPAVIRIEGASGGYPVDVNVVPEPFHVVQASRVDVSSPSLRVPSISDTKSRKKG